jgi:hypothetical protein
LTNHWGEAGCTKFQACDKIVVQTYKRKRARGIEDRRQYICIKVRSERSDRQTGVRVFT